MLKKLPKLAQRIYSVVFLTFCFATLLMQIPWGSGTLDRLEIDFRSRRDLYGHFNRFRYLIGDRVFSIAVVGKDGWLMYTGELSIEDYQNTAALNKNQLRKLTRLLTALEQLTAENGGNLVVIVAPNKNTIYSDYMPAQLPVLGQSSRLDQFLQHIRQNSQVQVLDLRPALREARQVTQPYYRLDSHWNCLGAHTAYTALLGELANTLPAVQPHPLSDFEVELRYQSAFDLASWIGNIGVEEVWVLTPKTPVTLDVSRAAVLTDKNMRVTQNRNGGTLPTALIFHDSFYNSCLNQFLEPHFERSASLPYTGIEGTQFGELILREQADLVLIEFTERYIELFLSRLQ